MSCKKYILMTMLLGILSVASQASVQDSIGIEKKDGKIYILHKVTQGETLYSLSRRYVVTVDQIKEANPEAAAGIKVGQVLRIPSKVNPPASNPTAATPALTDYKVGAGETLYSISKKFGITVDDLKKYNPGISTSLQVGQMIKVPASSGNVPSDHPFANEPTNQNPVSQNPSANNTPPPVAPPVVTPPPTPPANNTPPPTGDVNPPGKQNLPNNTIPKPNADYKRMQENGYAAVMEEQANTNLFLAWHKTAPAGTIIQVTNDANGQKIFVKVMGKLSDTSGDVSIRMTKKAYNRLGGNADKIKVSLSYLL